MISSSQHDIDFLMKIVDDLSQEKYPHDIEGGFLKARKTCRKVLSVVKSIEDSIRVAKIWHMFRLIQNYHLAWLLILFWCF